MRRRAVDRDPYTEAAAGDGRPPEADRSRRGTAAPPVGGPTSSTEWRPDESWSAPKDGDDSGALWAALTVAEPHQPQQPVHLKRTALSLSPIALHFRVAESDFVVNVYYEDIDRMDVLPELGQVVLATSSGGPRHAREYIVMVREATLARQLGDVIEFKAAEHRALKEERRSRMLWQSASGIKPSSVNASVTEAGRPNASVARRPVFMEPAAHRNSVRGGKTIDRMLFADSSQSAAVSPGVTRPDDNEEADPEAPYVSIFSGGSGQYDDGAVDSLAVLGRGTPFRPAASPTRGNPLNTDAHGLNHSLPRSRQVDDYSENVAPAFRVRSSHGVSSSPSKIRFRVPDRAGETAIYLGGGESQEASESEPNRQLYTGPRRHDIAAPEPPTWLVMRRAADLEQHDQILHADNENIQRTSPTFGIRRTTADHTARDSSPPSSVARGSSIAIPAPAASSDSTRNASRTDPTSNRFVFDAPPPFVFTPVASTSTVRTAPVAPSWRPPARSDSPRSAASFARRTPPASPRTVPTPRDDDNATATVVPMSRPPAQHAAAKGAAGPPPSERSKGPFPSFTSASSSASLNAFASMTSFASPLTQERAQPAPPPREHSTAAAHSAQTQAAVPPHDTSSTTAAAPPGNSAVPSNRTPAARASDLNPEASPQAPTTAGSTTLSAAPAGFKPKTVPRAQGAEPPPAAGAGGAPAPQLSRASSQSATSTLPTQSPSPSPVAAKAAAPVGFRPKSRTAVAGAVAPSAAAAAAAAAGTGGRPPPPVGYGSGRAPPPR
jgi:hypothetical protein